MTWIWHNMISDYGQSRVCRVDYISRSGLQITFPQRLECGQISEWNKAFILFVMVIKARIFTKFLCFVALSLVSLTTGLSAMSLSTVSVVMSTEHVNQNICNILVRFKNEIQIILVGFHLNTVTFVMVSCSLGRSQRCRASCMVPHGKRRKLAI